MTISILQLDLKHTDYIFMDSEYALKHGFNILHYSVVYTYKKDNNIWFDDNATLEEVFAIFNVGHPEDFKGRSVSVSDIIMIDNRMYYVEPIGFTKVL